MKRTVFFSGKPKKGQTSIEFAFAMIVTLLMAYALVRLLNWSGRDLAERRILEEQTLFTTNGVQDYTVSNLGNSRQLKQINPVTLPTSQFDGVWDGN